MKKIDSENNPKSFDIDKLAYSILWYMNYMSDVGRKYLLREVLIKIPSTEYLEYLAFKENDVKLEELHPYSYFSSNRYVDLVFHNEKSKEVYAFEYKYVRSGYTEEDKEKERLFADLMRLFYFLKSNKKGYVRNKKGFLIISGYSSDFMNSFQRIIRPTSLDLSSNSNNNKSEGFFAEWFSFDKTQPVKNINLKIQTEYRKYYDAFFEKYFKNKPLKNCPAKISTKLLFLSENNISSYPDQIKLGIWEITK